MIKYILFDLDGTLTDPQEGITKCVQYALRHFGIERKAEDLTCFIGPPLKEMFMQYASLSEEDGVKAVEIYRERFAPIGIFENRIYEGVLDMLSQLKKQGKILALATSKPTVFAERIADKYGISPYLTYLSGSELDGRNTDKALVIKNAMEALGAECENTIMVGDRRHDCEGSAKCNIKCIGVSYGYAAEGELEENGAIKIANTPNELLQILSKM
ncbi:MAG: HAD hydrolase-like protein [Clostridia bacterium]|nr:HAD hydrolase-like protein [Clostridia bacterium]